MGQIIDIAVWRDGVSDSAPPGPKPAGMPLAAPVELEQAVLPMVTIWAGCMTAWSNLWLAPAGLHIKCTAESTVLPR
jgi:hypothetical protein